MLYNGRSLVEDGAFAVEVLEYINKEVNRFKEEDGNLYAIYGTPAENLCGLQVKQFRAKYGIVEGVSDREYVSNSFHCHVTEDITPIEKQDMSNIRSTTTSRRSRHSCGARWRWDFTRVSTCRWLIAMTAGTRSSRWMCARNAAARI